MNETTTRRGVRSSNTTIKGITRKERAGRKTRFEARVTIPTKGSFKGGTIHIGTADTIGEAVDMRNEFIKTLF